MPSLPATAAFTGSTVTEAQFKAALSDLRAYLSGLMGADGTPATALATLGAAFGAHVARTAATTVTLADRGRLIDASGTWTLALPAAATAGAGFSFALRNAGAGVITIDPAGAELIDGAATLTLAAGRSAVILCTGTAWLAVEIPGKVTATAVDATAGRVLKVGDFGLGSDYGPPITDFTAELRSGFWRFVEAGAIGYPTSLSYFGGAIVARPGGSEAGAEGGHLVIAARMSGATKAAQRVQVGNRTTDTGAMNWTELCHQGNIVGTVADSGGVPSGAIIESGSSANGTYTKWADGTMIATKTLTGKGPVNTASGACFISGGIDLGTLPVTFHAAPARAVSTFSASTNTCWHQGVSAPGPTSGGFVSLVRTTAYAGTDITLTATFIGRWKA
ncbi:hypothetical protein RNZ50_15615 [Paracoccaceae bacterium Fryx2]|nr:hypothetical protein [Paracoccaceae bacterium Fryx2]